jgi:hypothetical protein
MEAIMRHLVLASAAVLVAGGIGVAAAQTTTRHGAEGSGSYGSYGTADTGSAGYGSHRTRGASGDEYTHALNMLQANGYTGIQDFRRVGGRFQATVSRDGRRQTVTVDPATGSITPLG